MYYAKIHHDRGGKAGDNMHVHVIVSRKDISNTKKISPQTNHKNTKIGVVKGGFNRELFVLNCEKSFDTRFNYDRKITESFEYCNAMKNGNIESLKDQVIKSAEFKMNQTKEKNMNHNIAKKQEGIEL